MHMNRKAVLSVACTIHMLCVSPCFCSTVDPLDDSFYESPSHLSGIKESLAKISTQGERLIKIGQEGVENSRLLVDLQVKQAVTDARSLENEKKLSKHSDVLERITEALSECIQKLNAQQESHDFWINIFIGIFMSGVSIFGTWHFIEKGKVKKDN